MTKPNSSAIIFVVDRSGSMSSIAADMRGGFDTFIADRCILSSKVEVHEMNTAFESWCAASGVIVPRGYQRDMNERFPVETDGRRRYRTGVSLK